LLLQKNNQELRTSIKEQQQQVSLQEPQHQTTTTTTTTTSKQTNKQNGWSLKLFVWRRFRSYFQMAFNWPFLMFA
jgi:hypothetical protein